MKDHGIYWFPLAGDDDDGDDDDDDGDDDDDDDDLLPTFLFGEFDTSVGEFQNDHLKRKR